MWAGFDGGGTKCAAVLIDSDGVVVARAEGGSTNANSVGWPSAEATFRGVAASLLEGGRVVSGACLGMAGSDRSADRARWTELACAALGLATHSVRVVNDAETALAAGTGGAMGGVAVIAGTGTIALARASPSLPSARAQGWGPLLGDEGSGHFLGQGALRAVLRSHDGRDPPTLLAAPVLAAAGCASPPELVAWAYGGTELPWARVAALAPPVEAAAAQGDPAAVALLDRAAEALAEAVLAAARACPELPEGPMTVVFSGGLLRRDAPVAKRLEERLGARANVVYPTISAAHAAALMAMRSK